MSMLIASSPHHHLRRNTAWVMQQVLLAMIPGILVQIWFFGWGVILQLVFAILVAVATEATALALRNRPVYNGVKR